MKRLLALLRLRRRYDMNDFWDARSWLLPVTDPSSTYGAVTGGNGRSPQADS